jgi:hypothetical protein
MKMAPSDYANGTILVLDLSNDRKSGACPGIKSAKSHDN